MKGFRNTEVQFNKTYSSPVKVEANFQNEIFFDVGHYFFDIVLVLC